MGLGAGVELEWSIVYHALVRGKLPAKKLLERQKASHDKLIAWPDMSKDAADAVEQVYKVIGAAGCATAYHSDELNIIGNPEPKTDVVFLANKSYCSVKMRGPIQLASGEGKSSSEVFKLVGEQSSGVDPKLKKLIIELRSMPSRLISETNVARLKQEKPEFIKQYLKGGKVMDKISLEYWKKHNLDQLLAGIASYVERNPAFHFALIREVLTGELAFARADKRAIANWILTPDHYIKIDRQYIQKQMGKTKIDVRAKSRSGISSLAVRFDSKA